MFRKQALILAAVFGLAAASTHKDPHAGKSTTQLRKVANYELCATEYPQYVAPYASQGGFAMPVSGGACAFTAAAKGDVPTPTGPVGVLSGTCGMNPYAGKQITHFRQSEGGADQFDQVGGGCQVAGGCPYPAYGYPQFAYTPPPAFPKIPQQSISTQVQQLAVDYCLDPLNAPPLDQTTTCAGTLGVRGTDPKNKSPGSELSLAWETTTTYVFAGATYLTETQYGLSGSSDSGDNVVTANLWGYTVFTSITCEYIPDTITHSPATLYGGSGKYEKKPATIVGEVQLTTTKLSDPLVVANPINEYQNEPIIYETNINVEYLKKGGYLHYSLL